LMKMKPPLAKAGGGFSFVAPGIFAFSLSVMP
jgi:hypothetical protein